MSEVARCFLNGSTVRGILAELTERQPGKTGKTSAEILRDTPEIVAESLLNSIELLASGCAVDSHFREIIGAMKQGYVDKNADTIRNRAKEAVEFLSQRL